MSKKTGSSTRATESPSEIASLTISGFKSILHEATLSIRPLTLLAGANSSGKSSMIQPLLLLKQTLEATYDPGPLLLTGPNVQFTAVDQFWPVSLDAAHGQFSVTIGFDSDMQIRVNFGRDRDSRALVVMSNDYLFDSTVISITASAQADKLLDRLASRLLPDLEWLKALRNSYRLRFFRERFLFQIALDALDDHSGPLSQPPVPSLIFARMPGVRDVTLGIGRVIHIPGLRGNPAREYPFNAIGPNFPGRFESYVASLVASWYSQSPERTGDLEDDLRSLGLTWKVEVVPVSDTQVELRVGRLSRRTRDGSRDMVSIADVGFGVSQALPV
ncbi:MAG: AAA family ATPase, partial [Isosphaeraceae bacterium]